VLRSGGRLILVDHVRSSVAPLFWLQRLMELAPSRTQDELTRRPIDQVRAAGFTIRRELMVVARQLARDRRHDLSRAAFRFSKNGPS
jgi:hypothetical protein